MILPSHVGAAAIDIETTASGAVLVSVPMLPGLGYASTEMIEAVCPGCKRRQGTKVHAALTSMYQRVATTNVPLYASRVTCERCALATR